MDSAAYLKYLQTVLKEFNLAATPNEEILICYFCDGLKLSIWAKTDEWGQDFDT